jgi:hypothetical protein
VTAASFVNRKDISQENAHRSETRMEDQRVRTIKETETEEDLLSLKDIRIGAWTDHTTGIMTEEGKDKDTPHQDMRKTCVQHTEETRGLMRTSKGIVYLL